MSFFPLFFKQHFNIVACFGDRDGEASRESHVSVEKKRGVCMLSLQSVSVGQRAVRGVL